MNRTRTLTRLLLALLCAVLSFGAAWTLRQNFAHTRAALEEQYTLDHLRTQLGVADAVAGAQGTRALSAAVTEYRRASRVPGRTDVGTLALLDADGMILWSDIPVGAVPYDALRRCAGAGTGQLLYARAKEALYLLMASPLSGTAEGVWLLSVYDMSGLLAEQTRQLHSWLLLLGTVLVLVAAALVTMDILQREAERRTRFLAAFSHELKTPMTAILGYADLLRSGEQDAALRQRGADHIYHEAARVENLSRALLALLGLQGGQRLCLESVPATALFEEVARSLPPDIANVRRTAPAGAAVRCDRALLCTLLRNLILNAAHASAPGAPIELTTAPCRAGWRLTVRDHGCGIPPADLPHVTEAFYRVDKSRARRSGDGSGSGLGLSLCAEIAQAHGSRLQIASTVGEGTTIWLELPAGEVTA